MKLCIDCKYYVKGVVQKCAHPNNLSLVDGKPDTTCEYQRTYFCGREGKNFKSKDNKV